MKRALAVALAALALAVAVGAPVQAAPGDTTISYVERTDEGLQILVSVPVDATVDTEDVSVTIDEEAVAATAVPADSTTTVRRTAVLVIDTSNSMGGQRITSAQTAAQTFLDTVPDDVYVGVVTFDGAVSADLAPTLDRVEARREIANLDLDPQTRLYDGVRAGLDMAGSEGQRQLLVLSDGADTSDTDLTAVTDAVSRADLLVNVVALEQDRPPAIEALESLADAGNGRVISADSEALSRAFNAEADVLARQVLVTAEVPSSQTAEEATVSVTLGSDAGDLVAQAYTTIGADSPTTSAAAPALPASSTPMMLDSLWFYGGLVALGAGLLVVLVLLTPRQAKPLTGAELATAYTARVSGVGGADGGSSEAAVVQATQTAEKVLRANKSLETRISERLDGAGNPFKPAEWLLVHASVFVITGSVGMLLSNGNLVVGSLFLLLGAVGPWMYLGFKRGRRRRAFERSLPDTLQLVAGSLAAGLSLAQSIDTVVQEGQEPISSEFRRVIVETRLGITLDDALEGVSDRFESKDFAWVVMAIRIQRQVGGNLGELLETVATTMREREYMRRQVSALAAEGKLSAWVLGGLPPLFMIYLVLTKPDYVMPMFTEPMGWVMLGASAALLGVGTFWMSRLVKVEV